MVLKTVSLTILVSIDDVGFQPDTPLFIDSLYPTKVVTNNGAKTLIKKFGNGLKRMAGVNAGDVVMVCAGNSVIYPSCSCFGPIRAFADLQADLVSYCISWDSLCRWYIYWSESSVHSRRQVELFLPGMQLN